MFSAFLLLTSPQADASFPASWAGCVKVPHQPLCRDVKWHFSSHLSEHSVPNDLPWFGDGVSQRMSQRVLDSKIANSALVLFKVPVSQAKSPGLGAGTGVIAISVLSGLLIPPKSWHQCLDTLICREMPPAAAFPMQMSPPRNSNGEVARALAVQCRAMPSAGWLRLEMALHEGIRAMGSAEGVERGLRGQHTCLHCPC